MAKRGTKSKFTKARKERIIQAIAAGCSYEMAADYAGITRQTLWAWLKKGEEGKDKNYLTFFNDIKTAEVEGAMAHLGTIKEASKKDWKASAWFMERRHNWSKEGIKSTRPKEEPTEIPSDIMGVLKSTAKDLKESADQAKKSESWQAYAALQRQLLLVVTQIRQIEAEEGMSDEMDGLTDEQLLAEIEGAIVSLPPILRQRLEDSIIGLKNVVAIGEKK
jgi:hypothetical protein